MQIALSVLGPLEVTWAGQPLIFATAAARGLLAYLALDEHRPHSREMVAALLWPDQPPSAAYTNLRQTVARVRKAFPDTADVASMLVSTPQTLDFNRAVATIDVVVFDQLRHACAAHNHADLARCLPCIERLQQASTLYRGEFLHGLSLPHSQLFGEWLLFKREGLHRQALELLHTLTQHYEAAGDYEQMRQYAARQVALEPWREEAHIQMMRALAYSGQRTAALAHYETSRRILAQALGIEPGADLQTLYARIRAGTFAHAPPATDAPTDRLPVQLTPFIGRERELAEIAARLRQPEVRLLTLVGAGGMGKTRLALEAMRTRRTAPPAGPRDADDAAAEPEFPDGTFFVALAPLSTTAPLASAAAIEAAIAAAIGVELRGDARQTVLRALRDKQMLLLLDNFEHLLDGVEIVVELLQSAPRLQLLVTSRERLNVRGEHVYAVEGMGYQAEDAATSPAIRLFLESARRVRADFTVSDEMLPVLRHICDLVQGMPLGIELAAAWVEMLPLPTIAAEIERSADFLAFDWRDAPERQRSMRAVFDWSWQLLSGPERQAFRELAVFRGGFTREAAQAVAGASPRMLTRLLHTSLLHWDATQGIDSRYEIHELLRQFAAEQLDAQPVERAAVAERHSAFYLDFVAKRTVRMAREEPQQAAAEIRCEIDNVRHAWVWAASNLRIDDLGGAAYGLAQFYLLVGLLAEGEARLSSTAASISARRDAGETAADVPDIRRLLSQLLALQAGFMNQQAKYDQAIVVAQQAITEGQSASGDWGEPMGYSRWGQALYHKGQQAAARSCLEHVLVLAEQARERGPESEALGEIQWQAHLGLRSIYLSVGDYADARRHGALALRLCQMERRRFGELECLVNMADIARETRDLSAARADYEHALRLVPTLGYRWAEGVIQLELGDVVRLQGEYGLALDLTERALLVFREIGADTERALALAWAGRLNCFLGNNVRSQELLAHFLQLMPAEGPPYVRVDGLLSLTLYSLQTGAVEQALAYAEEACELAQAYSHPYNHAHALVVLGHAQLGPRPGDAAATYRQAVARYEELGNSPLAAEPQAGLAHLALLNREYAEALAHVEVILPLLADHPRPGLDEPFFVYLVCYRVLRAHDDQRATMVLQAAQQRLQEYAAGITDDALRWSFLNNVATHRELMNAADTVDARSVEQVAHDGVTRNVEYAA